MRSLPKCKGLARSAWTGATLSFFFFFQNVRVWHVPPGLGTTLSFFVSKCKGLARSVWTWSFSGRRVRVWHVPYGLGRFLAAVKGSGTFRLDLVVFCLLPCKGLARSAWIWSFSGRRVWHAPFFFFIFFCFNCILFCCVGNEIVSCCLYF